MSSWFDFLIQIWKESVPGLRIYVEAPDSLPNAKMIFPFSKWFENFTMQSSVNDLCPSP
jgi:hypothetical protein